LKKYNQAINSNINRKEAEVENESLPPSNPSEKRRAESPVKSKLLPKNSIELDLENAGLNNEEDSVEEQMAPGAQARDDLKVEERRCGW
jgi:hypothetical protein